MQTRSDEEIDLMISNWNLHINKRVICLSPNELDNLQRAILELTPSDKDPVTSDKCVPWLGEFCGDGTPIVSWKRSASVEGEMTFSIQQSYAARMLVFCFGSEDVYRATTESTKPGTDDNISRVCRMPPAIPVCGRSDCVCLNHVRAPGKDNKARSTADTVQLTTEGSDHLEYSASISC
eukprot:GHVR01145545.1.p1 GENE.GHVR01145545.1~~GHVR01145545.1.p1  ORF type:complete len:179 (+),score=13.20 GHVR01145545.1:185-721(+)